MHIYCSRRKQSTINSQVDGNDTLAESLNGVSMDLMCPHCFRTINVTMFTHCDIVAERNGLPSPFTIYEMQSMISYSPDLYGHCECGKDVDFELIDPKMTPIIIILNKKNWKTIFSCQGHLEYHAGTKGYAQPYVMFDPDITDTKPLYRELDKSKYWKTDESNILAGLKIDLRTEYLIQKHLWDHALQELEDIAMKLPIYYSN